MTSQLIRPGLSYRPSNLSNVQSSVLEFINIPPKARVPQLPESRLQKQGSPPPRQTGDVIGVGEGSYPIAVLQSAYSEAPADEAPENKIGKARIWHRL